MEQPFYKFLFSDLDGTIRQSKSDSDFIQSPFDQEPIPGAKEAIAAYKEKRWNILGITNQGGVEAGHKTIEACIAEQRQTLKLFPEMNEIFFCPDYAGKKCLRIRLNYPPATYSIEYIETWTTTYFREPGWGMIALAKQLYGIEEKRNCSYLMVGDREEDKGCAIGANVNFMWAKDWREKSLTEHYGQAANA